MNYIPLLLLFAGGVVLTVGDIVMKKWVNTNTTYLYIIGLAIYLAGLNFLAQSYRFKNIAVASTMFVIFNVIVLSAVSWLYFKEPLSTYQIAGIVLGLGAIAMLEIA